MSQWARSNPEAARLEARRPDMAMEHWRMTQEGYEDAPEEEAHPLQIAINEAQNELLNECAKSALDEC